MQYNVTIPAIETSSDQVALPTGLHTVTAAPVALTPGVRVALAARADSLPVDYELQYDPELAGPDLGPGISPSMTVGGCHVGVVSDQPVPADLSVTLTIEPA